MYYIYGMSVSSLLIESTDTKYDEIWKIPMKTVMAA